MADTPKLTLPLVDGAQTQKHVTHNEALERLDVLVQLNVIDRDLATPPGSPSTGDTYIVAATATGDWTGQENNLAYWDGAAWAFIVPKEGWQAYIKDEDFTVKWNGSSWGSGAVPAHTHDAGDVTSGAFADARISQSSVKQHEAALAITEAQITDLQAYLLDITGESVGALSDVDLTGLADGDILKYNNANSQFEPGAESGGGITASSYGTSGYVQFDDGLIIQWMIRTVADNNAVTFPLTFPNNAYGALLNWLGSDFTFVGYTSLGLSGLTVRKFDETGSINGASRDTFIVVIGD